MQREPTPAQSASSLAQVGAPGERLTAMHRSLFFAERCISMYIKVGRPTDYIEGVGVQEYCMASLVRLAPGHNLRSAHVVVHS